RLHGGNIGDVEPLNRDTAETRGHVSKVVRLLGIAGGGNDAPSAGGVLPGELETQPAVGAGDEHDAAFPAGRTASSGALLGVERHAPQQSDTGEEHKRTGDRLRTPRHGCTSRAFYAARPRRSLLR